MIACDRCKKEIDVKERHIGYDKYGNAWQLCEQCKASLDANNILVKDDQLKKVQKQKQYIPSEQVNKRPLGITILAVLSMLSMIVSVITVLTLHENPYLEYSEGLRIIYYMFIGLIPLYLLLAIGLLWGKTFAWILAIIVFVLIILSSFVRLNLIQLILSLIILFYLWTPPVRKYFFD